jgi:tetratricopeptide (TPR) repeat protein
VRWSLHCEIECGGRADTVHWDLSVTAQTGMGKYTPGGKHADWTPVFTLYGDHWDPDNDVRSREEGWMGAREINLVGDLAGARPWLVEAARRRVPTAFNDVGAVVLALGEVDRAEQWFRRAMDESDWIGAVNLAKLHAQQGRFADAEEILRPAAAVDVPGAARTLSQVLVRQGRLDDAEAVLAQDAAKAPDGGIHPRDPVHDRLFRLAQFHLDQSHDVTRALDALRTVVDNPKTPLDAVATAAAGLDHLTVELANGAEPRLADASQAAALRVAAHRRLFASAPAAHRWPYDKAIEDQIALSSEAGDQEALNGALIELTNLRRSL